MARIDLLPDHYKIRCQAKRRRQLFLVVFFLFLVFGSWRLAELAGEIQNYRGQMEVLEEELLELEPQLDRARAMGERRVVMAERLELLEQLEGERLPWPALLEGIEGALPGGVVVDEMDFQADGQVLLRGQGGTLREIALFLNTLINLPHLEEAELSFLRAQPEGGFVFQIQGLIPGKEEDL